MKPMLRTAVLVLALGMPLNCLADTPEAAPVAALNTALLATMKAGSAGAGFQARYDALDPVVKQSFDLPVVEQNSVGFLWSTIPAAQQQELSMVFEQFTVASYVSQFASYHGEQIKLLPTEKTLGAKKIVETQIVPGDGSAPTELDYVVTNGPAGWQITDVLLNGTISQVAVHSSDFSSLVSTGDASQLISALKAKTAMLSSASSGHQ
jgi:phospholipid transport system substrate-binding protein